MKKRPEWAENDEGFSVYITKEEGQEHPKKPTFAKRKERTVEEFVSGILNNDRTILAQAITLIESNAKKHFDMAQAVIQAILMHTGKSLRIGITGVPGAGKSTFIEAFGTYLCEQGYRVAVLAVDPTSQLTGGSILGDKTRMELLTRNNNAFIRPSPSSGTLGGVHRKTRETMLLCEAANYDIILVETVGVGQSEVMVRGMVDLFLMLGLTGAGDELQGMKRGIMELVDAIVVNKADGDNEKKAKVACEQFAEILHYIRPATKGWQSEALTVSSITGAGIVDIFQMTKRFEANTKQSGVFFEKRNAQMKEWLYAMVEDYLRTSFFANEQVKTELPKIENEVMAGKESVALAVRRLIFLYEGREND